jgi:hypothetical protein
MQPAWTTPGECCGGAMTEKLAELFSEEGSGAGHSRRPARKAAA